jgi:hypothetical protein
MALEDPIMVGTSHSPVVKPIEYTAPRVRPGVVWSLVTKLWQFGSLVVTPVALCAGVDLGEVWSVWGREVMGTCRFFLVSLGAYNSSENHIHDQKLV